MTWFTSPPRAACLWHNMTGNPPHGRSPYLAWTLMPCPVSYLQNCLPHPWFSPLLLWIFSEYSEGSLLLWVHCSHSHVSRSNWECPVIERRAEYVMWDYCGNIYKMAFLINVARSSRVGLPRRALFPVCFPLLVLSCVRADTLSLHFCLL